LTSDHLRASEIGNNRHYRIAFDAMLLTLFSSGHASRCNRDWTKMWAGSLKTFSLAFYAAQNWIDHYSRYEDVASRIQHPMEQVFITQVNRHGLGYDVDSVCGQHTIHSPAVTAVTTLDNLSKCVVLLVCNAMWI
jgi:hypothetical protein